LTNLQHQVIDMLKELRSASLQCQQYEKNDSRILEVMKKYDILFTGTKFNEIYSPKLLRCLKTIFNITISEEEFYQILPDICASLKMEYRANIAVSDIGKKQPAIRSYTICLN